MTYRKAIDILNSEIPANWKMLGINNNYWLLFGTYNNTHITFVWDGAYSCVLVRDGKFMGDLIESKSFDDCLLQIKKAIAA